MGVFTLKSRSSSTFTVLSLSTRCIRLKKTFCVVSTSVILASTTNAPTILVSESMSEVASKGSTQAKAINKATQPYMFVLQLILLPKNQVQHYFPKVYSLRIFLAQQCMGLDMSH